MKDMITLYVSWLKFLLIAAIAGVVLAHVVAYGLIVWLCWVFLGR